MQSELESLSTGIDDFPSDLSSVFVQEESSKLENAAMELSSVPEALVTFRAARDKMKGKSEGKGEPAVSGKGKGKWRKPNSAKHLQDKLAARKSKSTCHECGQRGHWAGDHQCLEIETQISLLGQVINRFQIARTTEPSWWLNGLDNLASFLLVQICVSIQFARILSHIFDDLLSMRTSQFLLLSLARFIQHSQLILKKFVVLCWKFGTQCTKSDLGLGIIDKACFLCVAEDFHEIDGTREAEKYKFGDGGTFVSLIRVTAPVFVAGKTGRIVFSVVPSG